MHTRLQQTVSMQSAPEPHCRKPGRVRQSFGRKIDPGFLRHQIDIGENRDPSGEVLEDLSAPTCLRARIVAFPFLKFESQEERYQVRKKRTGASKRMVIMVTPTQAQRILPALLNAA